MSTVYVLNKDGKPLMPTTRPETAVFYYRRDTVKEIESTYIINETM